jgi:hypothetical protein
MLMNFTSSRIYHGSVTMAQGCCIHMVHVYYIPTSIKDLEMNHSVQYNAEARDPVILVCSYMSCYNNYYICTWWSSASNSARMTEK